MIQITLQTKRDVHANRISDKYPKKVPINLHQWLLGAQAENNVLLLLQRESAISRGHEWLNQRGRRRKL